MENSETDAEFISDFPAKSVAGEVLACGRHQWIPYLLPFLVFMLAGNLEPRAPAIEPETTEHTQVPTEMPAAHQDTAGEAGFIPYRWYPLAYALRIVLTLVAIGIALPMYRAFPFRISTWSVACGVVGVIAWVGFCALGLEKPILSLLPESFFGLNGSRAAFNPFEQLGRSRVALVSFLGVRFLGLVLVVPLIEEFFLRGFVARFVEDSNWWKLPIGSSATIVWVSVAVYAAASHPAEMIAAVVWFSLVTWLVVKTKNIWDAVAAHAVTNLLLGIYVVSTESWELW